MEFNINSISLSNMSFLTDYLTSLSMVDTYDTVLNNIMKFYICFKEIGGDGNWVYSNAVDPLHIDRLALKLKELFPNLEWKTVRANDI